jgi:hypothetical protein
MSAEMLRSLRLQRLVKFSDKRRCLQGSWEVHALQRLIYKASVNAIVAAS